VQQIKIKKKRPAAALSFSLEEEEEDGEEQEPATKKAKAADGAVKVKKNPNIDTSFLPDKDREEKVCPLPAAIHPSSLLLFPCPACWM
jgi:protein FAM50